MTLTFLRMMAICFVLFFQFWGFFVIKIFLKVCFREYYHQSSVQSLSCVQFFCNPMDCSIPVHHQLPELTQTHVPVNDTIQPYHPLSSPSPLSPIPPSIRVFSNESTLCMRWPKYWSFSFAIIPSKEHAGLISFRMHWLDLLTIQGTLESLL